MRHLLVEHVRVEGGVLLAGERVDVAAEDVDDLRDLGGGALLGALEDEVLEKVRRAAVLLRLDRRAAAQVVAERDRADVRKRLDQDGEAGGEDVVLKTASVAARVIAADCSGGRTVPCRH